MNPGLHFKIPYGVDTVTLVPVKRQLKEEFGFGTPGATNPSQASPRSEWLLETTMVTGDLNTALVEWIIQYVYSGPTTICSKCGTRARRCATHPKR